jgi:hypothetical protein
MPCVYLVNDQGRVLVLYPSFIFLHHFIHVASCHVERALWFYYIYRRIVKSAIRSMYLYIPELTRSPAYPTKHHICNMYRKGVCIGYRTKPPPPKKPKGATSLIYRQNLDPKKRQECKCRVLVICIYIPESYSFHF